jgi:hypothetical protein
MILYRQFDTGLEGECDLPCRGSSHHQLAFTIGITREIVHCRLRRVDGAEQIDFHIFERRRFQPACAFIDFIGEHRVPCVCSGISANSIDRRKIPNSGLIKVEDRVPVGNIGFMEDSSAKARVKSGHYFRDRRKVTLSIPFQLSDQSFSGVRVYICNDDIGAVPWHRMLAILASTGKR